MFFSLAQQISVSFRNIIYLTLPYRICFIWVQKTKNTVWASEREGKIKCWVRNSNSHQDHECNVTWDKYNIKLLLSAPYEDNGRCSEINYNDPMFYINIKYHHYSNVNTMDEKKTNLQRRQSDSAPWTDVFGYDRTGGTSF